MDPTSINDFDPNQFYRIINLGLGPELSLDVNNPPDGSLCLGSTGPYLGQLWQILNTSNAPGHFYLSSSFLGAKKKLDVLPNERGDFLPHLRDYAEDYSQTWSLTSHLDASEENRTTWTITPDFIGTGVVGSEGVFSVYNDTNEPYLAPLSSDDRRQRWSVMLEGVPVDDPSYSATHLPALATEAAIVPGGQEIAAVSATTSAAATPTAQVLTNGHEDQLRGSIVAAIVLPTTFFALTVLAFCLFIYMRRRKLRQLAENRPYSAPQHCASHCGPYESTSAMSQVLDSIAEKPIDTLHRQVAAQKPAGGGLTSLSLTSSNMSASLWSLRNPQESSASVYWNPLSAPPRTRLRGDESGGVVEAGGSMPEELPVPEQAKSSIMGFVEGEVTASPELPAKNARDRRKAARRARLDAAATLRASRPPSDRDI